MTCDVCMFVCVLSGRWFMRSCPWWWDSVGCWGSWQRSRTGQLYGTRLSSSTLCKVLCCVSRSSPLARCRDWSPTSSRRCVVELLLTLASRRRPRSHHSRLNRRPPGPSAPRWSVSRLRSIILFRYINKYWSFCWQSVVMLQRAEESVFWTIAQCFPKQLLYMLQSVHNVQPLLRTAYIGFVFQNGDHSFWRCYGGKDLRKRWVLKSGIKDRGVIDGERRWWLWWGDLRRMSWTRRTVNKMRLTEWRRELVPQVRWCNCERAVGDL